MKYNDELLAVSLLCFLASEQLGNGSDSRDDEESFPFNGEIIICT